MQQVGISASAMGAILREAPLNPLEVEEAVRKANSILLSLRSMATNGDQAQHQSFKKLDPKQRSR
jgi:hypothetical protein